MCSIQARESLDQLKSATSSRWHFDKLDTGPILRHGEAYSEPLYIELHQVEGYLAVRSGRCHRKKDLWPYTRRAQKNPSAFRHRSWVYINHLAIKLSAWHKSDSYQVDQTIYVPFNVTAMANFTKPRAPITAYFYISDQASTASQSLPLAIRTNTDSNLAYTPLDTTNEWLLAKPTFDVADSFHAQM